MRYLITLLLACMSFTAFSMEDVNVKDMSPAQRAALQEQLNDANKPTEVVVREEAEKWSQIGINIGHAMVGTAKELGMAAAEFAQTPLGKTVIAIVLIKMFGNTIGILLAALVMFTIGLGAFWFIQRRVILIPKYEVKPFLWGFWNRKIVLSYEESSGDNTGYHMASIVALGIAIIGPVIALCNAF